MKQVLLGVMMVFFVAGAHAELPYGPTDAELASLPPFCKARIRGVSKADKAPFEAQLGTNNFLHIHHYCIAANLVNRLRSVTDQNKRGTMMREAIANYMYVINAAEKSFWMRPQIHLEIGRVYLQMGKKGEALGQFQQAINMNPQFQQAYMPLIDAYRQLGDNASALDMAKTGLRYFPDSKPLQQAYLSLGGKQPFPEPIAKGEAAKPKPESPPPEPKSADEKPADSAALDGKEAPSDGQATEGENAQSIERGCRFCPPDEIQKKWRESFGEPRKQ